MCRTSEGRLTDRPDEELSRKVFWAFRSQTRPLCLSGTGDCRSKGIGVVGWGRFGGLSSGARQVAPWESEHLSPSSTFLRRRARCGGSSARSPGSPGRPTPRVPRADSAAPVRFGSEASSDTRGRKSRKRVLKRVLSHSTSIPPMILMSDLGSVNLVHLMQMLVSHIFNRLCGCGCCCFSMRLQHVKAKSHVKIVCHHPYVKLPTIISTPI